MARKPVIEVRDATPARQTLSIAISVTLFVAWALFANEGVRATRDFKHFDVHLLGSFIMVVIGTIGNFGVVAHHWMTPPHPKFLMLPLRLWSIRIHVLSGTIAIIVSVWALFGGVYGFVSTDLLKTLSLVQATCGVFHVISSAYQTPIVAGARAIMLPSYTVFFTLHASFVVRNFLTPGDLNNVLDQYLVICGFTWVRIYLVMFYVYGLAPGNEYTIGVVLAFITTMPSISGPTGVLIAVFYVVCAELTRAFNGVSIHHPRFRQLLVEIDRNRVFNSSSHQDETGDVKASDVADARAYFDKLDGDRNGTIDLVEIKSLLEDEKVDAAILQEIVRSSKSGRLTFEHFYRRVWSLRHNTSTVKASSKDAKTARDQARLVFNALDGDDSGYLESHEISRLLVGWGCPTDEVVSYLSSFDANHDGRISFEEFFTKFRPIWRFCFYTIGVQEVRAAQERALALAMDEEGMRDMVTRRGKKPGHTSKKKMT